MKLKYNFEMMELDDRVVAVPVGEGAQEFRGVVKLNESASKIFDLLKEETTETKVIEELIKQNGNDSDIPTFVHDVIVYLKNEGILD